MQRRHETLGLSIVLLFLACGLACGHRSSPQAAYDHAYTDFVHGDLKQSQDQAHRGRERFRDSGPEWAWRFRILEAESLLWRGMYGDALTLLNSPAIPPQNRDSQIEILAIEGAALAHQHRFLEADERLGRATRMCHAFSEAGCGDAIRAAGVLAVQRGQINSANQLFAQSLEFSRTHNDRLLAATALLNLGLTSLREEHFDAAIDWSEAAYQSSVDLGANDIVQMALGNLGWAYYNLGDSEKSLDLSLQAANRAIQVGDVYGQLLWITNAGYVYASRGDLTLAKQSYSTGLGLASKINGREDIYNAMRALALVSVESDDLNEARKYSERAIALAQSDNNRLNELYPLLVKGLIAARSNDGANAERIFHEVDQDKNANASLKWRSEHALAQLYENENRSGEADREYRAALSTFESARSTLQRNDSKLPFSNNASRIYDDFVHFLVARGKTDEALRWADYSRARTLAEGLGLLAKNSAAAPTALDVHAIAHRAHGTILFYWLGKRQSYLWAATPQKTALFTLPPGPKIDAAVQRYRKALSGPQDVLESKNADGQWLWGTLIAPAQALLKKDTRVFIIPDGSLNNLNFETLLAPATTPDGSTHFWIEDTTIANAGSLQLLGAAQRDARQNQIHSTQKDHRNLLLIGNSVSPNNKYPELPRAATQLESVARHFAPSDVNLFTRERATPASYLDSAPENFAYIHFVAHGMANRLSPLDSAIVLSKPASSKDEASGEAFKLHARDIMPHHLRARLVTISACYGAGDRWYSGEGLVGLSWAFLHAGAHNVVAALWDASDASTVQLMDKFYDELGKGASPDAALRAAKLSLLHSQGFHNPFYWAPFQLYTGS